MDSMDRREFCQLAIRNLCSTAAVVSLCKTDIAGARSDQNTKASVGDASTEIVDKWILQWQQEAIANKSIDGPLDVRRFLDPMYVLLAPIHWSSNSKLPDFLPVTAPRGFVTDFASVPRVFWSIFRPDGNYAYAAAIHDYLYWQQDRPKKEADLIFRSVMDDLNITDIQKTILFEAVNKFGNSAWSGDAHLKSDGEKRILRLLPENSNVTWAQWKNRPDVF
jgi:hypothetical protein